MATAFTSRATKVVRELRSLVHLAPGFNRESEPAPTATDFHEFQAIWDTGATNTAISQRVVDALGLAPISLAQVHTASGVHDSEVYAVCIRLPGGVGFSWVRVTRAILANEDILIGMDLITKGDFAISNGGNKTTFTFRHPAREPHIDFIPTSAKPPAVPPPGLNRKQRRQWERENKGK